MGEEFQFYIQGESYWVSRNQNGVHFTREADSFTQTFDSPEVLFEKVKINNKTIEELWEDIEI